MEIFPEEKPYEAFFDNFVRFGEITWIGIRVQAPRKGGSFVKKFSKFEVFKEPPQKRQSGEQTSGHTYTI